MDRPVNMHPAEIGALVPQVMQDLQTPGGGLLDGALEFVDEWVVNQIKESLWSVAQGNFPDNPAVPVTDEVADMEDHELQEFAAALFTTAAGQPNGLQGMLGTLGTQAAEHAVLQVEDWESRYDTHDIEDADTDPEI